MMPRAGGQYVFLREAFGPLYGLSLRLDALPGHPNGLQAAVAIAFAKYLGVFISPPCGVERAGVGAAGQVVAHGAGRGEGRVDNAAYVIFSFELLQVLNATTRVNQNRFSIEDKD
jgi:amino acid transporter